MADVVSQVGITHTTEHNDSDVNASARAFLTAAAKVFGFVVDNTQNTVSVYLKIWDLASGAVVGTTDPYIIIEARAGQKQPLMMNPPPDGDGFNFATGFMAACVTDPGTGGTTAPTNKVTLKVLTD